MSLDLVYVGFNGRVLALDRDTGEIVWTWKMGRFGGGFVTQLLDGDRLIVSVGGYLYCLDASTGKQIWYNGTKGHGSGLASIVSARGQSSQHISAAVASAEAARQSASSNMQTPAHGSMHFM